MSKISTICALHGFTGGGADFSGFSRLSLPEWRWICPDLPGHGENASPSCDANAFVNTIEDQCSDINRARLDGLKILLGYSMGGRAALLHACGFKNKWDALVLISTHPGIEPENERSARREADRKLASEALKLGAGAFIQRWQEHPLIQSQKTIRPDWHTAMQATRKKHSTNGLATSLLEFGQGSTPNLWPKLKQLRLPVLLLSGSLDKTYRNYAERMQIKLPNATHQSVEGAGHMPHLEKPEVTAEILKNFVKGLE